ncbi:MAG: hypothetical protein WC830_07630 [Burkholderiales bacterium]
MLSYLLEHEGMDRRSLEKLLHHESGLLGVCGISRDMCALLASHDARATEAVDLFIYRIVRELGSLAAALDALVFTAGIGENTPSIRSRGCRAAAWLGIEIDDNANAAGGSAHQLPGKSRFRLGVADQRGADDCAARARHACARAREQGQSRLRSGRRPQAEYSGQHFGLTRIGREPRGARQRR